MLFNTQFYIEGVTESIWGDTQPELEESSLFLSKLKTNWENDSAPNYTLHIYIHEEEWSQVERFGMI